MRLHVEPNTPHLVEVKNVSETAEGFGDLFVYDPAGQPNVAAAAGQIRTITLRPQKRFLKGYLNFTCDIRGRDANQPVQCQPSADGQPLGAVNPGETAQFALFNGQRAVHVSVIGADAALWMPGASDHNVNIIGGRNAYLRATFHRQGRLTVGFNAAGVAGDIYIDGVLVASQAATAVTYVAPGNHTVEGRNPVDPQANGEYRYLDASMQVYTGPNQARAVNLRPRKELLRGFGQITCRIQGLPAGHEARCAVFIDGIAVGTIEPGQSATYNLATGAHTVSVSIAGAQGSTWGLAPAVTTFNIVGGRTARWTATFTRPPSTPTLPAPPPTSGLLRVVMCQGLETTLTVFANGAIIRQESLHNAGVNEYALPAGHYDLQFNTVGYETLNVAADIPPEGAFTWYIGYNTC
jgi:hypothetical protein